MLFGELRSWFGGQEKASRAQKVHYVDFVTANDYVTPPPPRAREQLKSYSTNPWVRSIVAKVSSTVAKHAFYLEDQKGERIDKHPALDFLRAGNRKLRGRQAIKLTQTGVDLNGESFWVIGRAVNKPVEYAPVPADWVNDIPDDPETGEYVLRPKVGVEIRIPARDVLHFRDVDPSDPYGRGSSLTGAANLELETDKAASSYLWAFFRNYARPDMIISGSEKFPLSDKDRPRLEESWTNRHKGVLRSGRPFFSNAPLHVQELGGKLRDNQVADVRDQLKAVITEIYGIPPEIFGRLENSNRATIDAADLLFGRHTIDPRLSFLVDHIEPFLQEEFGLDGLKLCYESPVPDDVTTALQAVAAEKTAFTRNEIRRLAKLRPLTDPEFNEPIEAPAPLDPFGFGGGAGKEDPEDDPTPPKKPKPDPEPEDDEDKSKGAPPTVVKTLSPEGVVRVSAAHEDPQVVAEANDNRTMKFVLSSALEDRAGDTIDVNGWKLDSYLLNPVVLWGHDQHGLPIGRMTAVGLDSGRLVGNVQFATAEEYEFADTVYRLSKGGFLNAGSVGFRPLRWEWNDQGGIDFKEQELLEFSIVTVPCNPEALVNAKAAGVNLSPLKAVLGAAPSERFTQMRAALERAETPKQPPAIDHGRLSRSVDLSASKLRLLR